MHKHGTFLNTAEYVAQLKNSNYADTSLYGETKEYNFDFFFHAFSFLVNTLNITTLRYCIHNTTGKTDKITDKSRSKT